MKNCKYCNAEMEDEQTVCPSCGKDETEEAAEPVEAAETAEVIEGKVSPAKRVGAWVLLGLFILALVFAALIFLSAPKNIEQGSADMMMIQDTERNFTAEDGEHASDVVATCSRAATGNALIDGLHKLGFGAKTAELTNAQLSLYYWDAFYNIYNQNAYYLSLMGMDPAAMESSKTEGGQTWQEYFLSVALDHFREQTAVSKQAKAEGFKLPEKYSEDLVAMREELSNMEDIDEQLEAVYGAGVTLDDYFAYIEANYYYSAYLEQSEEAISISDEELDAYYAEHQEDYEQSGLKAVDKNVVSVRHILIRPEDSADETSWAQAQSKANEIYQQWQDGEKTEDSFAALAEEYSEDNAANGGLYEDVYPGQMVATFNDWCFADGRQSGDSGVVQTEYGYHIMYFVAEGDTIYWREVVRQDAKLAQVYDKADALKAQYVLSYDLDAIAIPLPTQITPQAETETEVPVETQTETQPETQTEQPTETTAEDEFAELQPEESIETVSADELAEMGFDMETEQPAA